MQRTLALFLASMLAACGVETATTAATRSKGVQVKRGQVYFLDIGFLK